MARPRANRLKTIEPFSESSGQREGLNVHSDLFSGISVAAIRVLSAEARQAFIDQLDPAERDELQYWWEFWARPEQLTPQWDWSIWLCCAGRGWGKTRVGAEKIREREQAGCRRMRMIAPTAHDARSVMVEGESGLLAICPPWNRPKYEPSKCRLVWPSGAIAEMFSADEPDRLRGSQSEFDWMDELAAWTYTDAFDQAMLGLRLGDNPQCVITTTPRPIALIKDMVKRSKTVGGIAADVHLSRGSTYDNEANLAKNFIKTIITKYEGTRIGRQELNAVILEDTPGALWTETILESSRCQRQGYYADGMPILPNGASLFRIVIGLDPAGRIADMARLAAGLPVLGGQTQSGDEAGIIVCGKADNDEGYVLEDCSTEGSPQAWGDATVDAYLKWNADAVILEYNHGGEAAEEVVLTCAKKRGVTINVIRVWASKGKYTRAEPISALYEQCRIHHLGLFDTLEDEMTTFVPGRPSPNRLDAAVFALTDLMVGSFDPGGVEIGGRVLQDTSIYR